MDPKDFARLLDRFNLCAEGYRRVRRGVQKRIVRHMQQLGCTAMKDYLARIDCDGEAEGETRRLMDVSISRFFRDEPLWRALDAEVLPRLLAAHPTGLRVWSAGCALGQEVYSFRILWTRQPDNQSAVIPLALWATDVNPGYLERAKEGLYPAAALSRVSPETRTRFFRPAGKTIFRVDDELREGIRWQVHDLTADPPPARGFHIVFARNNLLTYYRKEIVEKALPAVADSLAPNGYLVIGRKERLPGFVTGFDPHPAVPCLHRKRVPVNVSGTV